ncbi:hypothetical protein [Burkholderia stabilis]
MSAVRNGRWMIIARPRRVRRVTIRQSGADDLSCIRRTVLSDETLSRGIRMRDITQEALPARAFAGIAQATRHFRN